MEYLSDHPLLLSPTYLPDIETLSAIRSLSLSFRKMVDLQVKELALVFGLCHPVRHYKDLLYEYARIRFTSFVIPELTELWVTHAVKENKVEELRSCTLLYDVRFLFQYATSVEMIDFLASKTSAKYTYGPYPLHSIEVTLRFSEHFPETKEGILEDYINKDNVSEILALANTFNIDICTTSSLSAMIGPNLFSLLKEKVLPPWNVRSLRVRCHQVGIHFIENGSMPHLEPWARAGIYNVELMKYLFAKGVSKEYVLSLLDDIVGVCDYELLRITLKYLSIKSLEGNDYLLEETPSMEFIRYLHEVGGRICLDSMINLVEGCCKNKSDDPSFLEEMLTFYGKLIVHALNREWFHYEVLQHAINAGNWRIIAWCMKHRRDYSREELLQLSVEYELDFTDYDLGLLSAYERERVAFYEN